jgi:hypothetical protein
VKKTIRHTYPEYEWRVEDDEVPSDLVLVLLKKVPGSCGRSYIL